VDDERVVVIEPDGETTLAVVMLTDDPESIRLRMPIEGFVDVLRRLSFDETLLDVR